MDNALEVEDGGMGFIYPSGSPIPVEARYEARWVFFAQPRTQKGVVTVSYTYFSRSPMRGGGVYISTSKSKNSAVWFNEESTVCA